MSDYRTRFNDYKEARQAASGDPAADSSRLRCPSETGFKIARVATVALDISDMPRFSPEDVTFREAFAPSLVDISILAFGILADVYGIISWRFFAMTCDDRERVRAAAVRLRRRCKTGAAKNMPKGHCQWIACIPC